jgi:hypothetical protein
MKTTQVRDLAPLQAGNRRRWDAAKAAKAINALIELGWVRSITEHGLTLTEPPKGRSVNNTDA